MNKASNTFKKRIVGLHPNLILLLGYALATSEIDFFISEGVRTAEEQYAHYLKGRQKDKDGKIIGIIVTQRDGYKKKSEHQIKEDGYGYAADIYYVGWTNKDNNNDPRWLKLIQHIEKCAKMLNIEINCGYYWTNPKDNPHIELVRK